jgi:hypothetical protein
VFVAAMRRLELSLNGRVSSLKLFMDELIEYFTQLQLMYKEHYRSIGKGNEKSTIKSKNQSKYGSHIVNGLNELANVYTDYYENMRRLAKWM